MNAFNIQSRKERAAEVIEEGTEILSQYMYVVWTVGIAPVSVMSFLGT
jgi:hypothetical protein